MPTKRCFPDSGNLSLAWASAFLKVTESGKNVELSPLVVTITDLHDGVAIENDLIRSALDAHLVSRPNPKQNCHTVANTLFPQSMWNPQKTDIDVLFERYERAWPRIRACSANRGGTYFRRMTAYCPKGIAIPVNQLKHIITTYNNGNRRRSALQAATFDPTRDHHNSRRGGFPCLHQVAFVPCGNNELCVTGFYPMHYLLERAYGNYLGLCRLGKFMANSMGLSLTRMVCVSSVARLDNESTKGSIQPLREELISAIRQVRTASK